jgi:hypothetical protein
VEVFDLKTGKTINKIAVDHDPARLPYADLDIVTSTANNFTYTVMSNKKIQVFQKDKEIWNLNALDDETYVFVGYNQEVESVVIASTKEDSNELHVRPINNGTASFEFMFNPHTDILLKTRQHVLTIKMPPYAETTTIATFKVQQHEMLFNRVRDIIGSGFQVSYK